MQKVPNNAPKTDDSRTELLFQDLLLDSLNGKRKFVQELETYAMLGAGVLPPEDAFLDADAGKAKEAFGACLREMVDTWISSGINASGAELPKERKISEQEPFRSFEGWLIRNPPIPMVTEKGDLQIRVVARPLSKWAGMFNFAYDEAHSLFFNLLRSRCKHTLFKCSHPGCGIYFILTKPRSQYMRGSVCPEHRRQQGTIRRRKHDHAAAVEIAAEAYAAWPRLSVSTRSKHKSEKHYAASKLKRFGIGAKWVSRNLTEIKKREDSSHAEKNS